MFNNQKNLAKYIKIIILMIFISNIAPMIGTMIKKMREKLHYSQDQLSDMMGIGRTTLNTIESNKREVSEEEKEQFAQAFDCPYDYWSDFLSQSKPSFTLPKYTLGDSEKFKQLLLYILHKVGMKPNVGKVVLYKLLYFCEFDYREKYKQALTGRDYIKLPKGPAPVAFDAIVEQMQKDNEVIQVRATYGNYGQYRLIPNKKYMPVFTKEEQETIDDVLDRLSDANAKEISDYSHDDIPWKISEDMSIIDPSLASERQYPYSILAREQKKQQAIQEMQVSGMFDDLTAEPDLYEDYR